MINAKLNLTNAGAFLLVKLKAFSAIFTTKRWSYGYSADRCVHIQPLNLKISMRPGCNCNDAPL